MMSTATAGPVSPEVRGHGPPVTLDVMLAIYEQELRRRPKKSNPNMLASARIPSVKATCDACGFRRVEDIDPVAVEMYIETLWLDGRSTRARNAHTEHFKAFSGWLRERFNGTTQAN